MHISNHSQVFLKKAVLLIPKNNQGNNSVKDSSFYWKFFSCYLAAPRPTLGHYRGASLSHPILISAFLHIWPEFHREPCNEVGCLSPVEHLAGFESGTFWFCLQRPDPLGHPKYFLGSIHKSMQQLFGRNSDIFSVSRGLFFAQCS